MRPWPRVSFSKRQELTTGATPSGQCSRPHEVGSRERSLSARNGPEQVNGIIRNDGSRSNRNWSSASSGARKDHRTGSMGFRMHLRSLDNHEQVVQDWAVAARAATACAMSRHYQSRRRFGAAPMRKQAIAADENLMECSLGSLPWPTAEGSRRTPTR